MIYLIRQNSFSTQQLNQPAPIQPPLILKSIQAQLNQETMLEDFEVAPSNKAHLLKKIKSDHFPILVFEISLLNLSATQNFITECSEHSHAMFIGYSNDILISDKNFSYLQTSFHYLIQGDPELQIKHIIQKNRKKAPDARGTYLEGEIKDLDELYFPIWSNHELNQYQFIYPLAVNKNVYMGYLSTSRRYFCDTLHQTNSKKWKTRSINNIISEIKNLKKLGVNTIFFTDDNIVNSKEHFICLCEEIIKEKLDIHWIASAGVDGVDQKSLALMKQSGCVLLVFEVESGSTRMIDLLEKTPLRASQWISKTRSSFKICNQLKIASCAKFIIGSPTETVNEIEQSIILAQEIKPSMIKIDFFMPYPNSPYYKKQLRRLSSEILTRSHHYKNINFILSNISGPEIYRLKKRFYKKVMFRPFYLLKHFTSNFFFYFLNPKIFQKFSKGIVKILIASNKKEMKSHSGELIALNN